VEETRGKRLRESKEPRQVKKIFVEVMQNTSLGVIGEGRVVIHVIKDLDLIFAKLTRSTKMKIAGMFITEDAVSDFCMLPPISGPRGVSLLRGSLAMSRRRFSKVRNMATFLQAVNEKNDTVSGIK
jgi:hypothetical protein